MPGLCAPSSHFVFCFFNEWMNEWEARPRCSAFCPDYCCCYQTATAARSSTSYRSSSPCLPNLSGHLLFLHLLSRRDVTKSCSHFFCLGCFKKEGEKMNLLSNKFTESTLKGFSKARFHRKIFLVSFPRSVMKQQRPNSANSFIDPATQGGSQRRGDKPAQSRRRCGAVVTPRRLGEPALHAASCTLLPSQGWARTAVF